MVYRFELSKWFIAEVGYYAYDGTGNPGGQTVPQFCASLTGNYRVPSVGEYTNADASAYGWSGTLPGWTYNIYARAIGDGKTSSVYPPRPSGEDGKGGLFAEWGNVVDGSFNPYYPGSNFEYTAFWAREAYGANRYTVNSSTGLVGYSTPNTLNYRLACVSY